MSSTVKFEVIEQPGIKLDVVSWFDDEPDSELIIESFMALVVKTWEVFAEEEHLTMTLDGSTWTLYLFSADRVKLLRLAKKLVEYREDFDRTYGSGRKN